MLGYAVYSSPEEKFLNEALSTGLALSILVPISIGLVNWYFELGLRPRAAYLSWALSIVWMFPTALYLLYHPVTLPMPKWLEFGHPAVLGGIKPKVCENPTAALGLELVGGWPCFPAQLKDRIAKLAGPDGWKYLIRQDTRLQLCILFVVLNISVITGLVFMIRESRFDAKEARETCRLCGQKKPDTKPSKKGDNEKQY